MLLGDALSLFRRSFGVDGGRVVDMLKQLKEALKLKHPIVIWINGIEQVPSFVMVSL